MKRILIIVIAGFALMAGSSLSDASLITSYTGTNVTFSNITQSSIPSNRTPLFDQITGSRDTLQGKASAFYVQTGGGLSRSLKSTITTDITDNSVYGIGSIYLSHAGTYSLKNISGNAYADINVAVTITINKTTTNGTLATPISWTYSPYAAHFSSDTPSSQNPTSWNYGKSEDIKSHLSSGELATELSVKVDTTLNALSYSTSDSASISDKQLNITIPSTSQSSPVPVPASGLLLVVGAGLLLTGRGLRQTRLRGS